MHVPRNSFVPWNLLPVSTRQPMEAANSDPLAADESGPCNY
jgi:hypothetical protein